MLLMSSIPHHHHCTEAGTLSHVDYICFASQENDSSSECPDHERHNDDEHASDACQLHSIVTLLERIQDIPSYQSVSEPVLPQQVMPQDIILKDTAASPRIVITEKLSSFYLVRAKGLRAPPAFC